MDNTHYIRTFFKRTDFKKTLFGLSERITAPIRSALSSPWAWVFYLLLAVIFSFIAHTYSGGSFLLDWKSKHLPPIQAWQGGLSLFEFKQVDDLAIKTKLLRLIPVQTDQPGTVWLDSEFQALVVFESETSAPRLFYRGDLTHPEVINSWKPMGLGWEGFQSCIEELSSAPKSGPKKPIRALPTKTQDPREIRY